MQHQWKVISLREQFTAKDTKNTKEQAGENLFFRVFRGNTTSESVAANRRKRLLKRERIGNGTLDRAI